MHRAARGTVAPPILGLDLSRYRARHSGWRAVVSAAFVDPDHIKPIAVGVVVIIGMALAAGLIEAMGRLTR